jgi:hypothetical protein
VISDFESEKLDLHDKKVYTNLTDSQCFCQPEDLTELPRWENSAMGFTYLSQKALESEFVSENLHVWIDMVFGCGRTATSGTHRRIFRSPHPKKFASHLPDMPKSEISASFSGKCLSFFYFHNSIYSLNELGCLERAQIGSDNSITELKLRPDDLCTSLRSQQCMFFGSSRGTFSVVTPSFSGYYKVSLNSGAVTRIKTAFRIMSIAGSSRYFAVSTTGPTLIYEDDNLLLSLRQYRAQTTCSTVSDAFRVVVLGTNDGTLVVYDIPSGVQIREINLDGGVPHSVLVTDSFALIVVAVREMSMRYQLAVFSIDGVFIRKTEIPGDVSVWSSWMSATGLDFIVLATVDDEVARFYAAEAFYLDFITLQCKSNAAIVALTYLAEQQCILVGQRDGKVECFFQPSGRFDHRRAS